LKTITTTTDLTAAKDVFATFRFCGKNGLMDKLRISVPESVKEYVEKQVLSGRFSDASEYICTLVTEDQRREAKLRIQKEVLAGLNSGVPVEAGPAYWKEKRKKLLAGHRKKDRT
jgi:antitoxin ParD1/3/4